METAPTVSTPVTESTAASPPGEPCIMVLFGACGDLTKRLLMPAIYNLACDGLLPDHFAIIGLAFDKLTTEQFRTRMTEDIKKFSTRQNFDPAVWDGLVSRIHYMSGDFGDADTYRRLADQVNHLEAEHQTAGNVLFLTYARPMDNFVWTYRCRIEGNRVVWASEPGRWREGPKDDKVFFEDVDAGKQLRIIENHGDGSSTKQLFDRGAIL